MFNIEKFSVVLQKISDSYNSISEFAETSEVNRTYLSKYINKKLNTPPSPKVLMKIANNSNNIVTYEQLMEMCGYIAGEPLHDLSTITEAYQYENLLKKINLTQSEKDMLKTFEIKIKNLLNEGKEYDEIENIILQEIDKLSCDYNKDKIKKGVEMYSLSNISLSLLNTICNLHAENDTAINYLDALDKVKNLQKEVKESFYQNKRENNENNVFPIADITVSVPVLGKISAGLPLLATENIEGYEFAPSSYIKEGFDYFYLRVIGDSMNLKFNDGDIVLVQKQDDLENDEIGVILVDSMDATVKKYKYENGLVILSPMSTNPEHVVQIYDPKDISIKIIGKVVSYQGKI